MTSHLSDTKRSDGNTTQGLTAGEPTGLIVGIIGVILAVLTVFIGWKSRRVSNNKYYFMAKYLHIGLRRTKQTLPLQTSIITHRYHNIDVLTFRSLLGRTFLSNRVPATGVRTGATPAVTNVATLLSIPSRVTKGQHGCKWTGHLLSQKSRYSNSCSSTLITDD